MNGRSRLDILCEILLLLSKESLRPYGVQKKLRLNDMKCKEYLVLLERNGLIECKKEIVKYSDGYKPKRPFLRLSPDLPLEERGYYTRFVYATTEKGLKEVVEAWIKIKNHLHNFG